MLSWLLIASLINYSICAVAATDGISTDEQSRLAKLTGNKSPQQLIQNYIALSSKKQLSEPQLFGLAIAYLANKNFYESLAVARLLPGIASSIKYKILAYEIISQDLGAVGQFEDAGKAALEAQQLDPESIELGALRLAFFQKAGDKLQTVAATDYLQLHGNATTKVVLGVDDIVVIAVSITVIALVGMAYATASDHSKTADDIVEVTSALLTLLAALSPAYLPAVSAE